MEPSGSRPGARGALLALAVLLGSCTSTEESQPVGLELNRPVLTAPVRAWRLAHEATTLGYVVEFADPGAPGRADRLFFSVRNPWQQELGSIDGLGRAWRFVPHSEDPEWLSTGTVRDGAAGILRAPAGADLEEIPLQALGGPPAPSGG
jgi:hypothetical protein